MLEAAERTVRAIKAGKRIRIHGDYDADGVSATAILVWGLREVGANVHGFIPHRLNEGYGVHPDRVAEHAEAADLLITVDCGVTNLEEIRSLLAGGVEVIVTDHHSPGPDFPTALVVHPKLTRDYDPAIHNLTGAGVAYHLLWAVYQELGLPAPIHLTPLATLGTVADVAPLVGENRALVVAGLSEFERTELPGVRALMNGKKTVTARDVGFVLAPRINAAGRMGEADVALALLTTTHKPEAEKLSTYLEIKNGERRVLQDRMFKEALAPGRPRRPGPGDHQGRLAPRRDGHRGEQAARNVLPAHVHRGAGQGVGAQHAGHLGGGGPLRLGAPAEALRRAPRRGGLLAGHGPLRRVPGAHSRLRPAVSAPAADGGA